MSHQNVLAFLGLLLHYLALALLVPFAVAIGYGEADAWAFVVTSLACIAVGVGMRRGRTVTSLSHRDAFAIVTLGWVLVAVAGAVPFVLTGAVPSPVDALFEAISGVTTSGATVIGSIESLPHGLVLWRGLLQWLGGMGFVVLSLALLPQMAVGGMELFKAEVPSPMPERLRPRLRETSLIMWRIYIGLTIALILLLWLAGMGGFDATLHALTTIPTGGFSTKAQSIAAFDSLPIDLILMVFMFLSGTNFTLFHQAATHRRLTAITRNVEFRVYAGIMAVAALLMASSLWHSGGYSLAGALRHGSFQALSIMTTTGFASTDYNVWPPFATAVLFGLMFIGGSAGSTSGGVKVMRHLVMVKYAYRELIRLIHPRSVRPLRVGGGPIKETVIAGVLGFIGLYIMLFGVGTLLLAAHGIDLLTSASSVAAALGNVGPALGGAGPMADFAWLPGSAKLLLAFLMIVGRLEIYTVLVLLLPSAWTRVRQSPR